MSLNNVLVASPTTLALTAITVTITVTADPLHQLIPQLLLPPPGQGLLQVGNKRNITHICY